MTLEDEYYILKTFRMAKRMSNAGILVLLLGFMLTCVRVLGITLPHHRHQMMLTQELLVALGLALIGIILMNEGCWVRASLGGDYNVSCAREAVRADRARRLAAQRLHQIAYPSYRRAALNWVTALATRHRQASSSRHRQGRSTPQIKA